MSKFIFSGPLVPKKAENTPLTIEKHANIDTSSNENLPENFIKPFNGLYGDKNIVDMVQVMPPINQHLMNGESLIGGPPKIKYWQSRMNQSPFSEYYYYVMKLILPL